MKLLLFLIIISSSIVVSAQNERNMWYFGKYAGIDFNSGTAVQTTNGETNAQEGGCSIADSQGNLLFYSDGEKVWNKNHAAMPNGFGLYGYDSNTQNSLIVQDPGDTNIYYLFTSEANWVNNIGLFYSVIDMTLDGGLGAVTAVKNTPLLSVISSQKMTAIRHQNNCDYWIVVHPYDSDEFHSYLLTSTGINPVPVISAVGPHLVNDPANGNTFNCGGEMKPSDDGLKIGVAFRGIADPDKLGIFDFNKSTGTLSNFTAIQETGSVYGVEFSKNGEILYVSKTSGELGQYDLLAGTGAGILASKINLGTVSPSFGGCLQMAPDDKIYLGRGNLSTKLGVISNPNILGTGCNFNPTGFSLNNGVRARFGLPNFAQTYSLNWIDYAPFCLGDTTEFTSSVADAGSDVSWDFGDPASGINNQSIDPEPIHLYSDTGYHVVTLIINCGIFADTIVDSVYIPDFPFIDLGNDTSFCQNANFILDATSNSSTYLWSDGSTDSTLSITNSGTYWVEITSGGCVFSDTISLVSTISPNPGLDSTIILCSNEGPFDLFNTLNGLPDAGGVWSPPLISGTTMFDPAIETSGLYTYTLSDTCGSYSAVLDITINQMADASFTAVGPFCENDIPVTLVPVQTGGVWSGPGIDPNTGEFNISNAGVGVHTITYSFPGACGNSASQQITVNQSPTVSTINDVTINLGEQVDLTTTSSGINYIWSPNTWLNCDDCLSPTATPEETITYTILVEENGCYASTDVTITILYDNNIFVPTIFSPNGDLNNDILYVRGSGFETMYFMLFDRWGEKVFETTDKSIGWNGEFKNKKMNPAVFYYQLSVSFLDGSTVVKKGDVTLTR